MGTKGTRAQLKGNWGQAVLVEGSILCGQILLMLAEWAVMLGLGVEIGSAVFLYPAGDMRPVWARLALIIVLVVVDWLILSPLKLGRSVFYWKVVNTVETVEERGRKYFTGKLYRQALHWRLRLWGLRLGWSLLLWSPSIALFGIGEWMRLNSLRQGVVDLTCIGFFFLGISAFMVGWLVIEVIMMRYRPAAYGIGSGMTVREAFAWGKKVMKGHAEPILWLYIRYGFGLLVCLLALPALYVMPLFQTDQARLIRGWAKLPDPIEKTAVLW